MRPTPHLLRPIKRERRTIDTAISAGLALAIVAFLGLGFLMLWTGRRQMAAQQRISHTNEVLAALRAVSANLETATATQRGFLLTGDSTFLGYSRAAMASVVTKAREVRRLTDDNDLQQGRLDTLDTMLAEQLYQLRRVSAIRGDLGFAAAVDAFREPRVVRLMPSIRALLERMDGEERQLLSQRTRTERRVSTAANVAVLLTTASTILLAAFAAAALRRYLEKRRDVDRLKNDLVGVVAHELRNPLTAIKGALGLMRAGEGLDPARERLVTMASANSDRLLRLVDTMLDLEKIESGKLDLHYQVFAADVVIDMTMSGVAPLATSAGVRLEREGFMDAVIEADRDRLVQVLTNLVSNAIRFSPREEVVRVVVRREATSIRFDVLDRGPGVPTERRARLFGKFEQLHDGARGGSGLGLAISRAIVMQHGGEIHYEPREGAGSVFWFRIPVERTQ